MGQHRGLQNYEGRRLNMDDIIEMSGRLLRFDVVDKNGTLFPKDCEISFLETIPVIWNFNRDDFNYIIGIANVTKDEKGLICDVKLTTPILNRYILHSVFNDQLYIGGLYNQVIMHKEKYINVIDEARLVSIGTTFSPSDDELKMIIKETEKEQ